MRLPHRDPATARSDPAAQKSEHWLAPYPRAADRYDEMLEAPGEPRPHWRQMCEELESTSPDRMQARIAEVERQVRENGITYNVYADPMGSDRPWDLDLLPLILPHDEWAGIESAVRQRATLLNAVLADVYGEQRLLKEGLLPAALVYGHAGFLRPCHGIDAREGVRLHAYAADLARSPDGRWWVVADRTQVPSGAGYALENRLVISRVFPDLFRDLRVHRLASFFAALRDALAHWAPRAEGSPLIVLLTPGPYNETYFEHAYLARYLGFPLVEGSDLTVREGCVWLKTLSGLQRVHAIVRRLDDDYCDPLELRSDSALGIAGLTDAARRGNVLIANALGSSLLESGALLGFLPSLCNHLLGESLAMPSVATWWCGEPAALEEAIRRLEHVVIKATFPHLRFEPLFGEDLGAEQRENLVRVLRTRPHEYVAQELVHLSHAPIWDRRTSHRLLPRAVGLRVYACATPRGYVVMPGGLARVATGPDARVISMQRGGGSKDTWVLAAGPVEAFSLLRRSAAPAELARSGAELPSRVVENLYWFGRYAERCDNSARLLRLVLGRLIDVEPTEDDAEWSAIIALCDRNGFLAAEKTEAGHGGDDALSEATIERRLLGAVGDASRPGLAANVHQLFRVAIHLRERLSSDNWRTLNQLARDFELRGQRPLALSDALGALDRTVMTLMTLAGFVLDGMTRDPGWRFQSIGRRLERLLFLCAALQEAAGVGHESNPEWLLELADSTITYRSRYRARPEWAPVLDLLVCDPNNPRSLAFQASGVHDYLVRLAESFGPCGSELLAPSIAELRALDPERDLRPDGPRLAALLGELQSASRGLSDLLSLRFFSHVGEVDRETFAG